LRAASTASNPELVKITLPVVAAFGARCRFPGERAMVWLGAVQRSKVSALSRRASSALSAWGCTSPMACNSRAICFCPARTTRGLACPAAATPNAAVKSRYFRPSASQTCTPCARSHTIGHDPSGSMNVMFRDSNSRSNCRVFRVPVMIFSRRAAQPPASADQRPAQIPIRRVHPAARSPCAAGFGTAPAARRQ